MNSPVLNRILEKSPIKSLVALSVGAFLRSDNIELERIYGAMPSHDRASRHDFFIRHHAMTESILLWALEYWKTHSLAQSMTALIIDRESTPTDILGADFIKRAHMAKLATLIEAMRQICSAQGIVFDDVTTFAEVGADVDAQPIPKLIPVYVEMFGVIGK